MRKSISRIISPTKFTKSPSSSCTCSQSLFTALPRIKPATIISPLTQPFSCSSPRKEDGKPGFDEGWRKKLWGDNADAVSKADQSALYSEDLEEQMERNRKAILGNYKPALDGRTLNVVGLLKEKTDWTIRSFANPDKIMSPVAIHKAVHRATVEVYTNVMNGNPGIKACQMPVSFPGRSKDVTEEVIITLDETTREFKFDYGSEDVIQMILGLKFVTIEKSDLAKDINREETALDQAASETVEQASPKIADKVGNEEKEEKEKAEEEPLPQFKGGDAWTKLPFTTDDIKFAIIKRTIQLTGRRLSDNSITQMKNISHLLKVLITPPPPTKLAEVLLSDKSEVLTIPNVKVYEQRLRPLDRERLIGRLSPAQEELLWERAKLERGEVEETELDDYKYPFEKRGYI